MDFIKQLLPWIILIVIGVVIFLNRQRLGIVVEFWHFMRIRKRWWLLPIIVALILMMAFIVVFEALGPFMYAIF
jgi:hypothetical protein